jgi:hypothetical protein
MEDKQTAVQWLFKKLWEEPKDKLTWQSILEEAKDMEKEQIQKAYSEGYNFGKYGEESDRSGVANQQN